MGRKHENVGKICNTKGTKKFYSTRVDDSAFGNFPAAKSRYFTYRHVTVNGKVFRVLKTEYHIRKE
jgi:hypothetical protein